jgi:prevent-host-death family protein
MTTKKRRSKTGPTVSFLLLQQHRRIGAAQFKAHCLEILDEVERTGAEITITKHRKPVARIVPAAQNSATFCGSLKGSVLYAGDLISPIDVEWTADAGNLT